ncbi:AhpD family alkylhydroperoxidase [Cytobacillus horneckiae]|uniref:carboxymuconolactone decarboxylase family protein n=1 Tax=Cytobacillus horneckiae TaxID=549687 RepID=UPI0019D17646|nr:carboxymuconolactone decarboxylase family protein [Cytobacillus horneckiae]MBN6885207.1 carboxymuconolactone decarboxylase family protein [Cytobacillus horneckiae]
MANDSLYQKSYISRIGELGKSAPDAVKAFFAFDQSALADGVIPQKTKELIAIACAHVTGCPYCIEIHVGHGKKLGVTKEEMVEATMVATALKAGSAFSHGFNALNAFEGAEDDELYKRSNGKKMNELKNTAPEAVNALFGFDEQAMKAGLLSKKEKELIAVAVAHITGCAYCIDIHTKRSKSEGVSKEELVESIMVATALKAGSALAHGVNALNAFDE